MDYCFFKKSWSIIKKKKKILKKTKIIEDAKKEDAYKKILEIFS